jgi:hypothetical protein
MYPSQCVISKSEKEHHEHKFMMMSVLLRSTDCDYPFGIFKLFLLMTYRLPVVLAIVNVFKYFLLVLWVASDK